MVQILYAALSCFMGNFRLQLLLKGKREYLIDAGKFKSRGVTVKNMSVNCDINHLQHGMVRECYEQI